MHYAIIAIKITWHVYHIELIESTLTLELFDSNTYLIRTLIIQFMSKRLRSYVGTILKGKFQSLRRTFHPTGHKYKRHGTLTLGQTSINFGHSVKEKVETLVAVLMTSGCCNQESVIIKITSGQS